MFESGNGFHVIRWEASRGIVEQEYQEAKADVRRTLRNMKHQAMFDAWLENLRAEAEIEQLTSL